MCFILCRILKIFCLCACACAYICVYVLGFYIYPVWGSWNFLTCVESLIRFGKFSDVIHSNAATALFFTPSFLLHIRDAFSSVLHIFYALYSGFHSFLYFFLPEPQFQIHVSDSLNIFFWVWVSLTGSSVLAALLDRKSVV